MAAESTSAQELSGFSGGEAGAGASGRPEHVAPRAPGANPRDNEWAAILERARALGFVKFCADGVAVLLLR